MIDYQAYSSKVFIKEPLWGPNIEGASAPKPYGFRRLCNYITDTWGRDLTLSASAANRSIIANAPKLMIMLEVRPLPQVSIM